MTVATRAFYRTLALAAVIFFSSLWFIRHNLAPVFREQTNERHYVGLSDPNRASLHDVNSNISVNLVVATTAKDDISWTSQLQVPNLEVIRYVSDSTSAMFHPPEPKGREALMYFTYLHDFYDNLPDISIFIHAEEYPWHIDGALRGSMTFALERLNLTEVTKRHYFNLRTSWKDACPLWINTSKTFDDWDKREEPYMALAWQANFEEEEVPEMLGGPCCSQFAVTRDAIRSRPQSQYQLNMDWMMDNQFGDYIAGRVWEHMWPFLFKRQTTDCVEEWVALCQYYSICFNGPDALAAYYEIWDDRKLLKEKLHFWTELSHPKYAKETRRRIRQMEDALQRSLFEAMSGGRSTEESPGTIDYWRPVRSADSRKRSKNLMATPGQIP